MKGTSITLSSGTVITLGLRGNAVVAHAADKVQANNKGAIVERPVAPEALGLALGLDWQNLLQSDVTALTSAVGALA